MQFYQTRSNAIILCNTIPAMCIEKVVVMKSREELYSETYRSPPQSVVLKPNLNYERQDTASSHARTFFVNTVERAGKPVAVKWTSESKDCAIQLSKNTITSANRQSRNSFTSSRITRTFNPFSEKSKEMIHSMGNMEYFEICEIIPNRQCSNCMTCLPKGAVYCTCGRCLRPSDKVRKLKSDRYDVLSIPNCVINKGPSHGRRHENTERQRIYHQAHVSSIKAKKREYISIQDRFLRCLTYRQITVEHVD